MAKTANKEPFIVPLHDDVKIPTYQTKGACCADVYLSQDVRIAPFKWQWTTEIPLGFTLNIPEGKSVRMHLRSSVGRDYPIALSNGVGIIDSDFKGEVMMYVRNFSNEFLFFPKGTRLFQLELVDIQQADGLPVLDKVRGKASGSTGKTE